MVSCQFHYIKADRIYAFLLAEILIFQGSTHLFGVGSFSQIIIFLIAKQINVQLSIASIGINSRELKFEWFIIHSVFYPFAFCVGSGPSSSALGWWQGLRQSLRLSQHSSNVSSCKHGFHFPHCSRKKRQAHNFFRSHDLTLINAGILLQKKMDSAARVFFIFPFALSIVNITHLFWKKNTQNLPLSYQKTYPKPTFFNSCVQPTIVFRFLG